MKRFLIVCLFLLAGAPAFGAVPSGAAADVGFGQARAIGRLRASAASPWPWMQSAPGRRSAPILYPIDEASDNVVVGNTVPGSRIDVFANGRWIATGVARRFATRIFIREALAPGARVVAGERTALGELFSNNVPVLLNYTTYHLNNTRSGWDRYETALTTANVDSPAFGPLFTLSLDAETLAQPLLVGNVAMPGLGTHNVLFTVTENDTVYAFDADTGAPLWTTSLVDPAHGTTPVPTRNTGNCLNILPNVGITSTPVIDVPTSTMYVDAKIKHLHFGVPTYFHMLHAIDITTGLDKPGSPVAITATYPIIGGGTLTFDAQREHQRPGLLLDGGVVYLGFGSHCDLFGADAHGWFLGYSADTLNQVAVFNGSPNDQEGFASIWGGGFAPAADSQGNIFAVTGNGYFDGAGNWGNSVLRLDAATLQVRDSFTPYDQANLDSKDLDLGSGGAMIIPPQTPQEPELVVAAGKGKTIYLMSSTALGGFTLGGPDKVLQSIPDGAGMNLGVEGGPAYYVGPDGTPYVFYGGGQDYLKAWALTYAPSPLLTLMSQSKTKLTGEGGTVPIVTSNGQLAGTGIVWVVDRPQQGGSNHNVGLVAYDATNLKKRLYSGVIGVFGNPKGNLFSVPTVIDGRVYVSDGDQIVAYGLH